MLIGTRRALALFILSFYALQLGASAWLGPEELILCMAGLAGCYLLAFFGVAAEWFWARWFAMGLGNFGTLMLLALLKTGFEPVLAFIGGSHLAVMLLLSGEGMAAKYEHSAATQERYHFEQETMSMLRRAVKSAGSTLPFLILYAFAPREGMSLTLLAGGLGIAGVLALLSRKTAGLFALAAAGAIAGVDALGWIGEPSSAHLVWLSEPFTPLGQLFGESGANFHVTGRIFGVASLLCILPALIFLRPLAATWTKIRQA